MVSALEPLEERALLTGEAFAVIDGNLTVLRELRCRHDSGFKERLHDP